MESFTFVCCVMFSSCKNGNQILGWLALRLMLPTANSFALPHFPPLVKNVLFTTRPWKVRLSELSVAVLTVKETKSEFEPCRN